MPLDVKPLKKWTPLTLLSVKSMTGRALTRFTAILGNVTMALSQREYQPLS